MTRIEHLNHVMQKLKRKGLITPEEYETHNEMIHAVETLDRYLEMQKTDNEDAWIVRETLHELVEKLK